MHSHTLPLLYPYTQIYSLYLHMPLYVCATLKTGAHVAVRRQRWRDGDWPARSARESRALDPEPQLSGHSLVGR